MKTKNTNNPVLKIALGICALTMAATPFISHGQSIGVNFVGAQWSIGGSQGQMALGATDPAGVASQINWNNVDVWGNDSGGMSRIIGPNAGVISDNSGTATGVTFSYAGQGMWSVDQTTHTGNQMLFDGYSDVTGSANGHYNFGNISYSLYDVYVYVTADSNGRTAGVDINGGSQTYLLTDANGYNYSNPLTQATATTQGSAASAQYVLFQNVSGSSLAVDLNWYGNNVGMAGIQIVAVPEPSTLALSIGGLALVGLIRRRA